MTEPNNITFIMPAYRSAATIKASIESIVKGNLEDGDALIVVNDGSDDGTQEILSSLQRNWPFITIINSQNNQGAPWARNRAVERAPHSIIFNLDSDNLLVAGSIRKLKRFLLDKDADAAAFGELRFFFNEKHVITHKWLFDPGPITFADYLAGHYNPGASGNIMFTKESWLKANGYYEFETGLHDTWGFTLKQLATGSKLVSLPGSYYLHRYGHRSLYVRESSRSPQANSLVATRMIEPFLHLLDPDDAVYIQSDAGRVSWFDNLNERPIRLKSGEVGKTGRLVGARHSYERMRRLASKLWPRSA